MDGPSAKGIRRPVAEKRHFPPLRRCGLGLPEPAIVPADSSICLATDTPRGVGRNLPCIQPVRATPRFSRTNIWRI